MALTNITSVKIKNCIVDEIHIRQRTDNLINLTSAKEGWQIDSYLLAKFLGNLEAGNLANSGIQIVKFAIKRRQVSELTPITLGYVDYDGTSVEYTDYTQANGDYVYSIVPVGSNGLSGTANDVTASSSFVGWWLVDKENSKSLGFDKFLDSGAPTVSTQLNQGRVQIQTFSKFPSVYYTEQAFHSFTLSTVIIPSEFETSGQNYMDVLNNFILNHKPFLTKSSDGRVFVCDVSNARFSSPMNTWKQYDFGTISLDFVEIMEYADYMS